MATFTRYKVEVRKKGNRMTTPGLRHKVFEFDHEDNRVEFSGWASMLKFHRIYEDHDGHRYFGRAAGLKGLFTRFKAWRMRRFYEARGFEVRVTPVVLGKNRQAEAARIALGEKGISESPAGSNRVKYSVWYGMIGPWCAMFVSWVYAQAGLPFRYAYVPYIVRDARAGRNGLRVVSSPQRGDVVCYQFGSEPDHCGIFLRWIDAHSFEAIEGNTSLTSNDNGGRVMVRHRPRSAVVAFVRAKG